MLSAETILMRRRSILVLALAATVSFAAQPPDAAYLKDFEKWKGELVDDLKQNWLPLAGLFWLKPGANTFGAADDNAIVLPSGPAHAGTFRMEGAEVLVELLPGVAAKIGDKNDTRGQLQADVTGTPTVIELGALRIDHGRQKYA